MEQIKQSYRSPKTREVFVKVQGVLCQSMTGGFGVSNGGDVERGDDSVWGENLKW